MGGDDLQILFVSSQIALIFRGVADAIEVGKECGFAMAVRPFRICYGLKPEERAVLLSECKWDSAAVFCMS